MLGAHVFYFRYLKHAVFLRLGQRIAGDVGVDMNLELLVALTDNETVTDAGEIFAQPVQRLRLAVFPADDEHGVVGKGYVAGLEFAKIREIAGLAVIGGNVVGIRRYLAAKRLEHGLKDDNIALAACIHNAGLFEHRVLVDGFGKRILRALKRAGKQQLNVAAGLRKVLRRGGGHAGNGEDGALGGLHDRVVGGIHALAQRLRKVVGGAGVPALEGFGNAAEQQRENNSGISSRSAKQSGGGAFGDLAHAFRPFAAKLGGTGGERHAHVGAGVAVGHGEYI